MNLESSRKIKLLKMWEILKSETDEEHPIETNALIARLEAEGIEVDRKILYTDIEILNQYGFEVLKERGRSNRYYVEDRSFDTAEVRILMDAVQASSFITEKKTEELLSKIAVLAGSKRGKLLKEKITKYSTVKGTNESIYYSVDTIVRSIKDGKKISFFYFNYNAQRERVYRLDKEDCTKNRRYVVNPVATFIDNDQYYLICYDDNHEGKLANYRIDRMDKVTLLEDDITPNKEIDIAKYKRQQVGMFTGDTKRVTFDVDDRIIDVVLDKFGSRVKMREIENGKIRCTIEIQESPVFIAWCTAFGNRLRVVSPDDTIEKIKAHLKETAELYGDK
ncbi:MAG: WYL domain-containing protein [Clostridia bacterium]|nr:WYL domain-containing protein [Clostridia bacterium]